jgi:hypothetical protein
MALVILPEMPLVSDFSMSKVSGACLKKSSLRIPHVVAWLGISFMRILLVSKGAWEYLPGCHVPIIV